nr:DegT/DnrJ/EryC1/StrS family aminotransferase [Anaerolineae bacterium]
MSNSSSPQHRESFLPFSPPNITDKEIEEVIDTLQSSWITTGPKTREFERVFADYIGTSEALALNSCTAGLHIALAALGIGPGDEVITTPMTFCSSVNVIEHVGAKPVLVDIDPETLTIDPALVEQAITPRTCVILPVHYAGHPAELDPLIDLAARHSLYLIEDAAHALPAAYRGRRIGSIGHFTAFSFYATKNLTTAEGGMLTGSHPAFDMARVLSLHGMSRDAWNRYSAEGSWYYEVIAPGFKYNMTDIQAALGVAQLSRLGKMQARRLEIVEKYHAEFSKIDALQVPVVQPHVEHAWHLYVLRLNLDALLINRAQFIEELTARNIGSSVHFIPVHLHPYYRDKYGWKPDNFPVTYHEYQRVVSLPLNSVMTDEDVTDVIEAVKDIVITHRR